jgi:hypothetical protein
MTRVYIGASVSLDGYVAGPDDTGVDLLFAWMGNGDVAVPTADPEMTVLMTPENAEHWRRHVALTGAIVAGRHQPQGRAPDRRAGTVDSSGNAATALCPVAPHTV